MSLVSVIIPTHNRAALLAEAIDSVLQQTFSDFELIIVDDGSTDDTPQVVAAYDDPRIVYIRQDGQERGAARNRGVAAAHGEFITFLDDDDWFLPHKLAVQVPYLQANPEVGMVISGWDRVLEDGTIVRAERPWLHHPEPVLRNWLFAAMCHVAAMLMRRTWFERVGGFNQEIISGEDLRVGVQRSSSASGCTAATPCATSTTSARARPKC
jgi:glycosyltransferase involved in cell wall biosynthesis